MLLWRDSKLGQRRELTWVLNRATQEQEVEAANYKHCSYVLQRISVITLINRLIVK